MELYSLVGVFIISLCMFILIIRISKISLGQQDKKIAGVCAGLSEASDMPVWWIRIFFISFFFFVGYGFFLYLALWLCMVKVKKNTQL